MAASESPDEIAGITTALRGLHITNSVLVASYSWMIYDMLLTLQDEIEYLLRSKWNLTKILYIILRLDSLAIMSTYIPAWTTLGLSEQTCNCLVKILLIGTAVTWYTGQLLLLLRVCALYQGNRKVITASIVLYLCEATLLTALTVGELQTLRVVAMPQDNPIPGCAVGSLSGPKDVGLMFCIFDVLLSTFFFVLTVSKFLGSLRMVSAPSSNRRHSFLQIKKLMPILFLFFRDGSIYYFVVLASQVFFFTFTNTPSLVDTPLAGIGTPVSIATMTVATSRLVYSLRRELKGEAQTTTLELSTTSNHSIVFRRSLSLDHDCEDTTRL